MSALPRRWRNRLTIAMLGEYLREWLHPPVGSSSVARLRMKIEYLLVAGLFNVFPLPQKSGFRRSFAYAGAAMDRGWSVLVFPEGQRTKSGQLNRFMAGTGLLVAGLRAPVIPIRIDGLFELKQQRRHFARPGEVTVTFGKPIMFSGKETAAEIVRDLELRVASL
jgi:long-chain acyl-CoA synthetase